METTATPKQINPTDALYVKALKDGDNRMSRKFFYEETAGILHRIRMEVFRGQVDFDEMVSELYLYLSRDGWSRLDSFGGQNNCRLRTWMIPVAWRFFLGIRERMLSSRNAYGYDMATLDGASDDDLRIQIAIDVNAVLRKMQNRRYADIIRLLLIEGYPAQDVAEMLGMKVANVYNLKHRAIVQFIELYGQR